MRKIQVAFVAALAVVAVIASGWLVLRYPATSPSAAGEADRVSRPLAQPNDGPRSRPLSDALSKLDDKNDPFVVLVLGDSTTAALETNWLNLTTEWLSETYDRPAILRPWSQASKPPRYVADYNYRTGRGDPIEVWSAGASGQNAGYTLDNLDAMAPMDPESVDWVIINHGHNHAAGRLRDEGGDLLRAALRRWNEAPVTVIKQNPESQKGRGEHAEVHARNLDSFVGYAEYLGATVIDVYAAFERDPRPLVSLVDDVGVHPTPEGYALWAETVQAWIAARAAG